LWDVFSGRRVEAIHGGHRTVEDKTRPVACCADLYFARIPKDTRMNKIIVGCIALGLLAACPAKEVPTQEDLGEKAKEAQKIEKAPDPLPPLPPPTPSDGAEVPPLPPPSAAEKKSIEAALKDTLGDAPFEVVQTDRISQAANAPQFGVRVRLLDPGEAGVDLSALLALNPNGGLKVFFKTRMVGPMTFEEGLVPLPVAAQIAAAAKARPEFSQAQSVPLKAAPLSGIEPPLPQGTTHLIVLREAILDGDVHQSILPVFVTGDGVRVGKKTRIKLIP
jgi:hypothetical protein